jgi:hypothetical protein
MADDLDHILLLLPTGCRMSGKADADVFANELNGAGKLGTGNADAGTLLNDILQEQELERLAMD